jgi:hypothetical protein
LPTARPVSIPAVMVGLIVDDDLSGLAKGKNYTPDDLYEHYVSFGSDPFIVALDAKDDRPCLSAWDYAEERSRVSLRAESNRRVKRSSLLISPESFEPIRRECSVSRRVLDVLVPKIRLERARIVAVVCQFVAAGVAKHVSMSLDAQLRGKSGPFDHSRESRSA